MKKLIIYEQLYKKIQAENKRLKEIVNNNAL